jgi:hypothetical protein
MSSLGLAWSIDMVFLRSDTHFGFKVEDFVKKVEIWTGL